MPKFAIVNVGADYITEVVSAPTASAAKKKFIHGLRGLRGDRPVNYAGGVFRQGYKEGGEGNARYKAKKLPRGS
jgi:glutaminase